MTLEPTITLQKSAVAYVRVSTDMQTVLNQKMELTKYAEANKLHIIQFFEDSAVSGTVAPLEREGFAALMEFIKTNKVDHVLIFDLTRVGRTFWDTLVAIREIERYSVLNAAAAKDSFLNLGQESMRQLFISMLAWFAERERDLLIERVKAGLARAKATGTWRPRPKKPVDVGLMRATWLEGRVPYGTMAKMLGVSIETLYKRLADEGLIIRHKRKDYGQFKYRIATRKPRGIGIWEIQILEILRDIGAAASNKEIARLAKIKHPDSSLSKCVRHPCYRLKVRGIIGRGQDNKWFIVEQKPV